jgi:hypothetical protein
MKRMATALMLLAMPGVVAAQAPACIPQDQAAALVTFALPTLTTALAERCAPELPANAYMVTNAQALSDRYAPDAAAAWPVARQAIGGLFQQFLGQPMPPEMDAQLLRTLVEPMLGNLLAKQVQRGDCAIADRAMVDLAPLSGRSVGRLVALGVTIADRKDKGIAGVLHVCRPGDSRR